jgi:hypothetical protein
MNISLLNLSKAILKIGFKIVDKSGKHVKKVTYFLWKAENMGASRAAGAASLRTNVLQ